jgi:dihydroneopterin aldolase
MNFHLSTHLSIEGVQLDLFIGCSEKEREKRQAIEVDVHLFFSRTPLGCLSDEPRDIVNSTTCMEIIQREANKKPFHLLEHLAHEIHSSLRKELPMHLEILVRVRKLHPEFPNVKKGIAFTYFPKKDHEEKKRPQMWDE